MDVETSPPGRSRHFSLRARLRSFSYAFAGITYMLRTQHNAWIHVLATIVVVATAAALQISLSDWRWIVLAIFLVWAAEALNTAVEHVCDLVSPNYNIVVKRAKDVAAAAVLFSACSSVCIGALTFLPYLMRR